MSKYHAQSFASFKSHQFEAASRRLYSLLFIEYLLFLGEQADPVLDGVNSPTHDCQHEEQTDHDNRNGNVLFDHIV